jgi:hypothetical protein
MLYAEGSETDGAGDTGDAVTGDEPYAIPEGSAYLMINGIKVTDITYVNDANRNAIQNAVVDAVQYASSELKQVTVVVQKGVYQGGLDMSGEDDQSTLGTLIKGLLDEALKREEGKRITFGHLL